MEEKSLRETVEKSVEDKVPNFAEFLEGDYNDQNVQNYPNVQLDKQNVMDIENQYISKAIV